VDLVKAVKQLMILMIYKTEKLKPCGDLIQNQLAIGLSD
jgi:hypothetical protein